MVINHSDNGCADDNSIQLEILEDMTHYMPHIYSLVVILFVAAPATAFGTPAAQRDNFVVSGSGHR